MILCLASEMTIAVSEVSISKPTKFCSVTKPENLSIGTDLHQRARDIVSSRGGTSSPERSLLGQRFTSRAGINGDQEEEIDLLTLSHRSPNPARPPPTNIFDDL